MVTGMAPSIKVQENRLRRMAARQGLAVEKCRARDPHALGYGTYRVTQQQRWAGGATGIPGEWLPASVSYRWVSRGRRKKIVMAQSSMPPRPSADPSDYGLTLEDVEQFLTTPDEQRWTW